MRHAPLIITMGDPSGIGPEITAKACASGRGDCIVMGCVDVMGRVVDRLGLDLRIRPIARIEDALPDPACLQIINTSKGPGDYPIGKVSAQSGQLAYDTILAAIELAKSGRASGIITAPIHKEALAAAGIQFPGHTEILAEFGGAPNVAMMLANDELRTVLVTIHCSLAQAIQRGDYAAQVSAIRLAHQGGVALGFATPRIAVAGLNPHAGEGGLFGREEIDIIAPAIAAMRAQGIDVTGPWPGDTVFMAARQGKFDVVVAQYHDQGLIPVKYLGVEKGVNITLGLPFVRSSPDHGTAFDIAGQGVALADSMITAIDYARRLRGKMNGA
jgi:4-hydroxythreonine-4-phosphate dehydrogenase